MGIVFPVSYHGGSGRRAGTTDVRFEEPLPSGWLVSRYTDKPDDPDIVDPLPEPQPEPEPEPKKPSEPLRVKSVNLMITENSKVHHTDLYDITKFQLIIRRGEPFKLRVRFNRPYDDEVDQIDFVFTTGKKPKISKDTLIKVHTRKLKARDWSAEMDSPNSSDQEVQFTLTTAPDCIVAIWNLCIDTKLRSTEAEKNIQRYEHPLPLYVLFNPWCKDDVVYMKDEIMVDEYILNDRGRVYIGNYKQIGHKPWYFGQYEEVVMNCVMYLLDKMDKPYKVRGDPVHVCRSLAALTNAPDDNGILVGNWSGKYEDGTAPAAWVGSVAILEEYFQKKEPVKFGQCWVFSGLVTTLCRCLGIPCRSVTNFSSAHDCDGSITIDVHWNEDGEPINSMNDDSIWNFHVWNEGWMARPDLPAGFSGWQAFDATPQETSDGIYTAGPSPVEGIKQGFVNLRYDTAFIFAEVNADKIHWIQKPDGDYHKVVEKYKVGKRISTKNPRKAPKIERNNPWTALFTDDPQRLDLTDCYKFKEGTEEERTSVYRANTWSTRPGVYDFKEPDVKFEILEKDGILVGNPFSVVLKAQNKSRAERNILATITLHSIHYTGVTLARVKTGSYEMNLQAIKGDDAILHVAPEEYLHLMVDQVSFKISVMAEILETGHIHTEEEDFRLRRPDLELEVLGKPRVGVPFDCKIKFKNSMPLHLTKCEWQIEGCGLDRKRISHKDMEPYEITAITVKFTPKKAGECTVMASLDTKELTDITGSVDVDVME